MTTPISKQRLQEFLFSLGVEARCPFSCYALPSPAWIQNAFASRLYLQQCGDNVLTFKPGRNVCTHFTRYAAVFAARCHLLTPDTGEGESSLAFGIYDFTRPDGTEHSVNIAVCETEENALFAVWFEPQTRLLTVPEIKKDTVPFVEI